MARTGIRASAIIIKGGKILLIHRKKDGEEYWVFPGGGIEDNETWDEALIREVKEETALDVKKHKLSFMNLSDIDNKEHPFYICEVSEGEAKMIGEETQRNSPDNWYQLEWVELKNLSELRLLPENAKEKVIKLK
ncbi:MAG TPA: NUDIX domain-containing protein [Patescibacteria group bacterium]